MMRARRLRPALALITAVAMCAAVFAGGSVASAAPTPSPSSSPSGSGDPLNIVDKDATAETKSLFAYLNTTRGQQVLFGAQHTTDVGITFNSEGPDNTDSDVLTAVDDYPAIFGFDTFSLEGKVKPGSQGKTWQENVAPFAQDIQTAHRLGGIPTMAGHMMNFETGVNSASDPTGRTVSHILPGGDKNAMFNEYLDAIAEVANTSTDDDGNKIPIIFRPFHENNGSWFWWGASNATTGEFKEIFRYTVEYLRDTRDVHNFLYAFSPNGFFAGDEATYLDTYPGDPWVDVLGYDAYESSDDAENSDEYIGKVVTDLAMVSKAADHRGKISAFTEFGRNSDRTIQPTGNKSKQFFTDLLNAINLNPDARRTAYMQTWANWGGGQIYTPYGAYTDADGVEQPAHEMQPDFQAFYDDDYSGFADDIPADALTQTGLTATPASPTMRIVSPADGVRVTEESITVRVKATTKTPKSVSFTGVGVSEPQALTLAASGYWEGTWNIGAENLTNAASEIDVVATYVDGLTKKASSSIILGEAPTLPNGVVDNFEGYGDDDALRGAYTYSNTTASDLTLESEAPPEGKNSVRFAYDFDTKGYQGFGKSLPKTQDWSGFDQLNLNLVPDGSKQKLVLQFNAGGQTFEAYPSLAGTDPLDVSIPFSEFKDKAGDNPAPTAEQLKKVTQFWVYINKTEDYTKPGSIGLDNIRATSESTGGGEVNIADKNATAETKSLYSYLNTTRGKQVLFGMQHTTDNGITFKSTGPESTNSDVKGAVNDYPGVFGFDTLILEGKEYPGVEGDSLMENAVPFAKDIQTAHRLGGIPTISTHMKNFATGNDFHDTSGRPVSHILPGGDKNAEFNEYLDALAEVANTSIDDDGNKIPIIFRPFHENTGNFFWWGAGHTTVGEYKEIFRYTVEYLRETRDVHNFLYSFSPNGFFAGDQARYLETYPGDEWIDILGYDVYENSNEPENSDEYIAKAVTDLAMISKTADARDKISAFTEFGRNGDRTIEPSGNKSLNFFTDLLNGIKADPDARNIAYMLTWANWGNGQIYVPYAGFTDADGVEQPAHEMLPDFQAFYDDPYSGFVSDIPADALTQTGLNATAATPTLRVVSPADGVRIVQPTTTVRIKATVKKPESVSFTVTGNEEPQALTLGDDGYWTGEWNIGQENLTNATVTLTAVATYADGADKTATSSIILGEAPPLPNGVFDTFEGYGDDAALQGTYTFNNTTAVDLTLDPNAASEGKNGARFSYNFDDKGYQGFGRAFTPTQDWSEFDRIGAHLTPDGSNQKLVMQFNAGGATFEAYPSLAGTDPLDLSIPFSEFKDKKGDRPAPTAEQLKSVTQFWVYLNKTDDYTEPGSIGLDDIRAMSETTPPGPIMIDVPTAPVWTDQCGIDNNGFFSGYRDTDQYAWKLIDRSTRTGKVRITVRAKEGYAFRGVQRRLWTKQQDNSRCAAAISVTTTPQTCSSANQPVPGSLTLNKTDIAKAYVYEGAKTGTKAGDLSALDPGDYLIIATAKNGSAFNDVPAGWKPSPSKDADGNVVKVSRVATVDGTDCG